VSSIGASPQPDDAPPERIGGLLGGKRTAEVGRREQQAFHASAGIAKGGSAQRVTRRGRQAEPRQGRPLSTGEVAAPPVGVIVGFENVG
jgi:hypothetical protein